VTAPQVSSTMRGGVVLAMTIDESFLDDFRQTVDDASRRLRTFTDDEASRRPAPGKWSRKEIIGHLIDSASNNHGRFVRAQLQDDLIFAEYDQDEWVRLQDYQERRWSDLVALWQAYNHHIAAIMQSAGPAAVDRLRVRHNLHELAWIIVPPDQPTTLGYFMRDYVGHLKHHLRQALDLSIAT
jgi:hypothetical protein